VINRCEARSIQIIDLSVFVCVLLSLDVCQFVTLRYGGKTARHIVLSFLVLKLIAFLNSHETKTRVVCKNICHLQQISHCISETVHDRAIVTSKSRGLR